MTLAGLVGTKPLEWWLKNLQSAKISWFQKKTLACAASARMTNWIVWYRKNCLAKQTAQREQGFEHKVS
jgi:hypothetical protein